MLLNNRPVHDSLNEYCYLLWAPHPRRGRWTLVTQICLEGTISNGGGTGHLQSGNNVVVGSVSTTVTCPNAATYTWTRTSGSLSYYASGNFMSFNMPSGNAVAFRIEARNGSNQLLETRNVSYYNYGTFAAFPNPTTAEFKIDVLENEELDIIAFRENNTKAVTTLKYCAKESVDVSQWEKGTYILHIYHRKELVKTERLIVQ